MKHYTIAQKTSSPQVGEKPTSPLFFPRIIREFDDGPDEKPMIYGEEKHG